MDKNVTMILKVGATVVGATAIGTWATRRTSYTPLVRAAMRAAVAGGAAYFAGRKMPALATGLGVYAVSTLASGAVEQYDMSRYLAASDATRAQLGAGSTGGGASTTGASTTGATPGGNGYYALGGGQVGDEGPFAAYQAAGYAAL